MEEKRLKQELHDRYIQTYKECKRFHYSPTRFLEMISGQEDVVSVTKRLIHKEGGTAGFAILHDNKRMDLSVEKIILEPRYRILFTEEDLKAAYNRLKEYNYERLDEIEEP